MPELMNTRDEFSNRLAVLASGAFKEPSIPDYMNFQQEPLQDTCAHVLNVEKVHSAPVSGATSVQADSDSMCPHHDIEPFPAGQQGVSAMQEGIRYHAPFDHYTCEVEGITMMADDAPKSEGCLEHTLADKQSPGPLGVQAPDQMHKGARWWDDYLFGCHPVGRMFGCCCIFSCNDILACGGWVLGFDISDYMVSPLLWSPFSMQNRKRFETSTGSFIHRWLQGEMQKATATRCLLVHGQARSRLNEVI